MVDTILLERLGVPAAAVGTKLLMSTTGRATARLHGLPAFPIVHLPEIPGVPQNMLYDLNHAEMDGLVDGSIEQVVGILTGADGGEPLA